MKKIAVLWDEIVDTEGDEPFEKEAWNTEYEFFSELAEEAGVELYLAHFTEYEDGFLGEAYVSEDDGWEKVRQIEVDGVFDKFRFDEETRELKKEIAEDVGILNDPELERICKDKLETGKIFSRVPETRKATESNIREMMEEDGRAVVKPRYDFGGRGVQIIESMEELEPVDPEDHVVQRFVDASTGIPGTDYDGVHDLRAYVVDGEVTFGLVRVPDEGLISNVARGGRQEVFPEKDFRDDALEIIDGVMDEFEKFSPSMYSVDLIYDSNGDPLIVELNSKPGLSYYEDQDMKDKVEKTVRKLVEGLKRL